MKRPAPAAVGTAWAVLAPNGSLFDVFFFENAAREHVRTLGSSLGYKAVQVVLTKVVRTRAAAKRPR